MTEALEPVVDVVLETAAEAAGGTPWWMVVVLGMGIVFIGLGLMVLMCNGLRLLMKGRGAPVPAVLPAAEVEIPDRKRLIAAVSAAVAEAEGSSLAGFRIVSLKRRGSL